MTRYTQFDAVEELGDKVAPIRKKTATVVGLGSIGSAVAEILARAGVNLRIIDRDRVYEEDLPHLSLFGEAQVSKFKAKEAKKILEGLNKDIKVKAFHEDMVSNNAYLVESDVIIECSNDMNTALLADGAAKKTPLIYARSLGVEGHVLIADDLRLQQLTTFLDKIAPESKSPILGSTSRIIASIAANKALKILTGQKIEKNCLQVNAWKFSFDKVPARKNTK